MNAERFNYPRPNTLFSLRAIKNDLLRKTKIDTHLSISFGVLVRPKSENKMKKQRMRKNPQSQRRQLPYLHLLR
jgi:hypothetical protein